MYRHLTGGRKEESQASPGHPVMVQEATGANCNERRNLFTARLTEYRLPRQAVEFHPPEIFRTRPDIILGRLLYQTPLCTAGWTR